MTMRNPATQLPWQQMLGIESHPVSHRERWISALGGFVGLLTIYVVSHALGDPLSAPLLIFSVGASAILVFAVPHGSLSQPWPVFGGHLVAALIGVACARLVPNATLAAATAVGLSILVMHYLRCIHPPGGATALVAVLGGPSVQALGFGFVLAPVLLNVLVLLAAGVAFNAFFPWRRYPAFLARRPPSQEPVPGYAAISHEDFVFALTQMDSFIDVSEEDLLRIYTLATGRTHQLRCAALKSEKLDLR
jgi:CBS-domain-containing membrane protein